MKTPIALELTSACIEKDSDILVVSRKTVRYRKVLWALKALILEYRESFFFYLE